jgi:hypothetical protein
MPPSWAFPITRPMTVRFVYEISNENSPSY